MGLFMSIPYALLASKVVHRRIIWSEDECYLAFTSLAHHKKYFYCAFRIAKTHVDKNGADNGEIMIIRSKDAISWEFFKKIAVDGYDLRDPKLIVDMDKNLSIMLQSVKYENGHAIERKNLIADLYSNNNAVILRTMSFPDDNEMYWLWDAKWIDYCMYGYLYIPHFSLVCSTDGTTFTELSIPTIAGRKTESVIGSYENGLLLSVVRVNGSNTLIGVCNENGEDYEWHDSGVQLESPVMVKIGGRYIVAGRYVTDNKRTTSLFELNAKSYKLEHILDLPSSGDCGYPGISFYKGKLFISYYNRNEKGYADIHLAVVKL